MLAARRTDSVTGRMILLVSSIRTIKGIRAAGVPAGTRCAKNSVKLLVSLNMIKASYIRKTQADAGGRRRTQADAGGRRRKQADAGGRWRKQAEEGRLC